MSHLPYLLLLPVPFYISFTNSQPNLDTVKFKLYIHIILTSPIDIGENDAKGLANTLEAMNKHVR